MADRSIVVRLRAEVQGFNAAMAQASRATEQVGKDADKSAKQADTAMGRMVQSATRNREAWETSGRTLAGFGAATLGALGLATKAAMDWESSWAGVQKTVEGTAPQMEALEGGLRSMARELPASHEEIAAVAQAAGQLGVSTPNVLAFTRTMIDMGESTNMSAEEAATSLARFMNVMGTSQSDVGRLGAAVVGLGNNFATTESEIVQMGQRLSGASAQAGLTEGEVLGLATAMSSVGIEAEAGGSAMSLTMKRIGAEVDSGGSKLEMFAQVAGMSAEQFSKAWREDPAAALDAFVSGLSRTEEMGMSTNAVLTELGITGIRESDALLRLSSAAGVLGDAMAMGNEEFARGSALVEEAAKRYETTESRIRMARNALVDMGISIGGVVLPAVADLADSAAGMAGWFADLPGPVTSVATALGGLAGVGSLAAGAFLLIFPRVMDTVQAFTALREKGSPVPGVLGRVAAAAATTAAAFTGFSLLSNYGDSLTDFAIGANEAADMAMKTADAVDPLQTVFSGMGEEAYIAGASVDEMASTLDVLANGGLGSSVSDFTAGIANAFGANVSTMEDARQRLEEYGQGLAGLIQTDLPAAQDAFKSLWDSFGGSAEAGANLLDTMPAVKDALIQVAMNAGLATDDATLLKIASGELTPVMDETAGAAGAMAEGMDGAAEATQSAADAAAEALGAIQELANEFITGERAALDYADSLDAASAAAEENGKAWENGTEAADENKRALLDLAEQALATADSLSDEGKSGTFLATAREDLIEAAIQFGATREEAEKYVDQLGLTPESIETQIELDTSAALEKWSATWDEIGYHPPQVPVGADTDPAKGDVAEFGGSLSMEPPPELPVGADTAPGEGQVMGFEETIRNGGGADVNVGANVEPAQSDVNLLNAAIDQSGGTVVINGNTVPGDQALSTLMGIINSSDGTVMIDGFPVPAEEALGAVVRKINAGEGTVDIEGDNSGANNATDAAKRKADNTTGTIDVDASTGGAESDINRTARDRDTTVRANASTSGAEGQLNRLARRRTAVVHVSVTGNTGALRGSSMGRSMRAAGGPVWGPGTGTSDSIPAMLSNGEHVITAAEVAKAGGQDAIYRMRQAINAGFKFAAGGGVENGGYARAPQMSSMPSPQIRFQPANGGIDTAVIAAAVRAGAESARLVASISNRGASSLVQQGNSGLRAFGGKR